MLGGNTQTILEALVEHRVQLCLIEGPAMRRDVQVEPFMEDHMVCVVPAGHAWADQEVDLKELQQATLVTPGAGFGFAEDRRTGVRKSRAGSEKAAAGDDVRFDRRSSQRGRSWIGDCLRIPLGGAQPACVGNPEAGQSARTEPGADVFVGHGGRPGTCRDCRRLSPFCARSTRSN